MRRAIDEATVVDDRSILAASEVAALDDGDQPEQDQTIDLLKKVRLRLSDYE